MVGIGMVGIGMVGIIARQKKRCVKTHRFFVDDIDL
jgi:hypothetical protein